MTPTLWPGFSPSWLQPDNFLASKAIWYPAARQRCGSNREASRAQSPWKQEGHPLSPSCSRQLGAAAKPCPKSCRAGHRSPPVQLVRPREPALQPVGLVSFNMVNREKVPHVECRSLPPPKSAPHPHPPPPRHRCFPTSTSHRTQAHRKAHLHKQGPCQTQESSVT